MTDYRLSDVAREDLVRIHQYGAAKFGMSQADLYIESLFRHFDLIAERPLAFESVEFIRPGYRRCVCGVESIFYRINENVVEIMAIVGRQDIHLILS